MVDMLKTKQPLKIKESQIQTSIEHYLNLLENQGKLLYIKCNSGAVAMPKKNGFSWVRFGKKGLSDFVVFIKTGLSMTPYFIEVKAPTTGKQSPEQINFQNRVEKLGGEYYIVRSVDEALKILDL